MALKKVTPLKVSKKETNPKTGQPWQYDSVLVGLEVASRGQEGTTEWINGFCKKHEIPLVGNEIEVEIWQSEYGWNWKYPKQTDLIQGEINSLKMRVERLEGAMGMRKNAPTEPIEDVPPPEEEINPADIPF